MLAKPSSVYLRFFFLIFFTKCSSRVKMSDSKAYFKYGLGFPDILVVDMSLKSEFCSFQKIDGNPYNLPGQ